MWYFRLTMKLLLVILLSAFTLSYCSQTKGKNAISRSKDFQITFDTLNISVPGYLRNAVLFHNNFYCMFETDRKNTTQSYKKMIVVSQNGEFIEDVFVPEGIQDMPHYDLTVQDDSLFAKESQFEKINFVLGAYVADFKLTPTKELKFYRDELYDIYATCNGEWGGTIYFKNKRTKEIYEAASTCPTVINRIDNDYYVTNYMGHMMGFASVLKIADPTKLEKSDLDFNKHQGSRHDKGVEALLDTMNFYIPTSFVADKQLFHLFSDDNGTYVGKIENKKMTLIYKFDFVFSAHFNQHLDNGQQLLTCQFRDSKKSGLLIIDGRKFKFYRQN
jgi:hypothetical protein